MNNTNDADMWLLTPDLSEAVEMEQSWADKVDCTRFLLTVGNFFLIDDHGLAAEFIGKLLDSTVVLDIVDSLSTLEVQLKTLLWLKLLKSQNEFINIFEDFSLINFDELKLVFLRSLRLLPFFLLAQSLCLNLVTKL